MLFAISAVIGVLLYIFVMALIQPKFAEIMAAKCYNCSKGKTYWLNNRDQEPGEGHGGEGFGLALFWPFTAPYVFTNARNNPAIKRGKEAINNYWHDKAILENAERTRRMEKELNIQ